MMRAGSIVVAFLALQQGPPRVYVAPDREPTPEETLILEYMNRWKSQVEALVAKVRTEPNEGAGR